MIARFASAASAALLSGTVITGVAALIAFDIGGEDLLKSIWSTLSLPFQKQEAEMADVAGITLFRSRAVDGANLTVTTGYEYVSQRALADNEPGSIWCYIKAPAGYSTTITLTLLNQTPPEPPVYADLESTPEEVFTQLGLGRTELTVLARSHCQPRRSANAGGGDVALA